MYEHKTIIDSNGLVIERCVLFEDGVPIDFKIEENQQVVNRYTGDFIKPQLVNEKWTETATNEEIEEYKKLINAV